MKNIKNILVCVLVVVMCALLFTACQTPGETPTVTPEPTGTAVIEDVAAKPEKLAMKAGDVYRIFVHNNMAENEVVDGVTGGNRAEETRQRWLDFQGEYNVTVTWVANTSSDAWVDAIMQSAAAGDPIADIFHMGGPFVIPLALGFGGTVAGTYFDDLSVYGEYTNFADNYFWDQSAQQAMGYYNGGLYVVVPHAEGWGAAAVNQVTFFNKALIQEGGYTAEEMYRLYNSGEWTFDKYREVALACTNVDKGVYGTAVSQNGMAILSMITANGASVLTPDENGIPQFSADSEKSLRAINFFLEMCKTDGSVCLENGVNQVEVNLFKKGNVALMLTYANRATEGESPRGGALYQKDDIDYGIILPPKGPDAEDYRSDKNWASPLAVVKGHENPAGVAQCLSYYMCPSTPIGGATQNMMLEAEAQNYFRDNESIQTLKDAVMKNVTTSYMVYWQTRNSEDLTLAIATTYQFERWVAGESTPEIDYATFKDAVNAIIRNTAGG